MFGWFEKRINPFPPEVPETPPARFLAFCLHYSKGVIGWLVLMAVLTAMISVGEVMLFSFLGNIVDWLTNANRETFLRDEGMKLAFMGGFVLIGLPLIVLAQSTIMHQVLLGNYPMIARWQMHRYLLRQTVSFFANEFAGRVSTKVMQTSLAVREVMMKVLDVLVYVVVYFISMLAVVAAADWRLAMPLVFWLCVYIGLLVYFIPKLRKISEAQADARSMMTGRIVDSYTNISTVKLFSHAGREECYAKEGMQVFLDTVHGQMRYVTLYHSLVYFNNAVALFLVGGLGLWFWQSGVVAIGALAVSMSLTMRINGMSQWIMWEISALFENVGTVYDGMAMLSKKVDVVDREGGEGRFRLEGRNPLRGRALPLWQEQGRHRASRPGNSARREDRSRRPFGGGQDNADDSLTAWRERRRVSRPAGSEDGSDVGNLGRRGYMSLAKHRYLRPGNRLGTTRSVIL